MNGYQKVDGVAKALGIAASTVKKYYLLIEEHNYRFKRSVQGQVMFSDYDISLFRKLIRLKNEPGMTLHKAVEQLLKEEGIADTTNINRQIATVMAELTDLKQLVQKQNEMTRKQQEQLDRVEEQTSFLCNHLERLKRSWMNK
ncbi:hypothetical protein CN326_21570 [Bacillus sp. AFS018417]|uniref:MerR family transcriptional regulator n=1 Tax=Bacillus sp. AFS018417 TaxID=2033491 RepID=UPI000BF3E1CB|nr:MerR family transcriptional regulator [Bacillus sp. AFS018417]PEZ01343.1 hypothetical protein CN326_21570 [Bacillus sp. AFS018417]